jgi:hypothetical protein
LATGAAELDPIDPDAPPALEFVVRDERGLNIKPAGEGFSLSASPIPEIGREM